MEPPQPMDSDPPTIHEEPKPNSTNAVAQLNPTAPAADSDSSSDSDDDDDNEAQNALQLQTLESELSRNPTNYDLHVQYISLLRKMGEIDKVRLARQSMSEIFPLTPTMWQHWARDEITMLSSSGDEGVPAIEKIYERGVSEYLSVPLWCDYLDFVQEHEPSIRDCSAAGVSKARDLFERALTAAGLHFSEGGKIWEAYIDFERAIGVTLDDSNIEAKEKQIQRIRTLFHRRLSVPLADMNSSVIAYKSWELEQGIDLNVNSSALNGIPSHVASAYQKAQEMYNARVNLEEHISNSELPESERLLQFKRYLKFEESAGDPARVQILYERAITEFPITSDLWVDYTRYLYKTLKVGTALVGALSRATRNCPWMGELWVRYLLCLERTRTSEEEVSLVFEKALQCTFSSFEEYLDLYLTRVDGLRRRISAAGEMQVFDYAVIRDTFQRASDYLSQHLNGTDALLHLYAYWARLELSLAKDIAAARGAWESLLKISGTMLEAWKGYISMEIENGNLNEARSIYRRCYTKRLSGSGSEEICRSWLRFEREFGSLDDYDFAVQKVSPRLDELSKFRLQQDSKTVVTSNDSNDHLVKKNVREKRKPSSAMAEEQSPLKRQRNARETNKKETKKDHNDVQNVEGSNSEERITNTEKQRSSNKQQKKESTHEPLKYSDQCTAFVSNLSFTAISEDLRKFFSDVGGVQSIRILKDKYTGKSRGLAYVDFSDNAHLDAAVAKNKRILLGKKLSIARSDPSKSKKRESGASHEENKDDLRIPSGNHIRTAKKESAEASNSADQPVNEEIQRKRKNIFALPRSMQVSNKPKADVTDEKPKSNDELRELLLKK